MSDQLPGWLSAVAADPRHCPHLHLPSLARRRWAEGATLKKLAKSYNVARAMIQGWQCEAKVMVRFRDKVLHSVKLDRLEHSVREERFPRIFDEISQLIEASERAYAKAADGDYKDAEYVAEISHEETETIEELIGVAFLVLQMKITRVRTAACRLFAKGDCKKVLGLCGHHEPYKHSRVELIWEVANYYKHPNAQGKVTLEVAKELGLLASHRGNMAMAFEKLGITRPYSGCRSLALHVQDWGEQVLRAARGTKPE